MLDFLGHPAVYNFVKGPLVWVSFIIFAFGSIYRIASLVMLAKKDKVVYPYMSFRFSLRSILHWIVPFGTRNWRKHPWVTVITFLFHFCLLFVPIFLLAHNMLIYKAWGVRWWTLPDSVADGMTLIFISCCIFFLARRILSPEVRFVTFPSDYIMLAISAAPFVTGFLAFHQNFSAYQQTVVLHVISGEVMLAAIPFSRLSHMLFFWLTRAHTGSEFGVFRHSKDY